MVPVRAALPDREPVDVGFARTDAVEAQPGTPSMLARQNDAVPVDRRVLVQRVGHAQRNRVAFVHRSVGAGTDPLTVKATREHP